VEVQSLESRRLLTADLVKTAPATLVIDDTQNIVTTQKEITTQNELVVVKDDVVLNAVVATEYEVSPTQLRNDVMVTSVPLASAGTVSVTVSRSGDVVIKGDAEGNVVYVEISGGTLIVTGGEAGTKFRVPGQDPLTALEVPLPTTVRSLSVNLGRGADMLQVVVRSDVSIPRDVTVDLGEGDDVLSLEIINADVRIGQSLTIDLGAGNDSGRVVLSETGSLVAARDINIRTGAGADTLLVADNDYATPGSLANPTAFTGIQNNTEIVGNQRIRAGRDITVNLGLGNDQLTMVTTEAGRDLTINGGTGADTLAISNLRSSRNLSLFDAEQQVLQNMNVSGKLTVRTGGSADRMIAQNLNVGRLEVDLGAGNDTLALGNQVTVRSGGTVNGGAGNNSVSIAAAIPRLTVRRTSGSLTSAQVNAVLDEILSSVLVDLDLMQPSQAIMAE
jgi:hypothetical protein